MTARHRKRRWADSWPLRQSPTSSVSLETAEPTGRPRHRAERGGIDVWLSGSTADEARVMRQDDRALDCSVCNPQLHGSCVCGELCDTHRRERS